MERAASTDMIRTLATQMFLADNSICEIIQNINYNFLFNPPPPVS